MTTATRKQKTPVTKLPLLQMGDRITGNSRSGTPYAGTFQGYTSKDWIICNLGQSNQVALDPATVSRLEPDAEAEAQRPNHPAFSEGDRIRGESLEGKPLEGIVTQLGKRYAVLNNTPQTSVHIETAERLQVQAIPQALLHLVGKDWEEQVDAIFADHGICNLAHYIGTKPTLYPFDRHRDWQISFTDGTEIHLRKSNRGAWFFTLSKFPALKGNGDITTFCQEAIDLVEDTLAIVEAGMKAEGRRQKAETETAPVDSYEYEPIDPTPAWFDPGNGIIKGQAIACNGNGMIRLNWADGKQSDVPGDRVCWQRPPQPGDRIRITDPDDIDRLGTVQPPWDSQAQATTHLKILLDGDEVCRAFTRDAVEVLPDRPSLAAPMQSIGALLPAVQAGIATNAQTQTEETAARLATLATEIAAIYAEAEEAEATMLNAGKAALSLYLSLGEKLLDVKANLNHGEWLPWLKERGIQERKAQRAIAVHRGRDILPKNVTLSDITLTEAMSLLSKKGLKSAEPDQESGVETQNAKLTPDAIEQQYALTGDHATPTLDELIALYSTIGTVKKWGKGFAVERGDRGAPFPLCFRRRADAWQRWQQEWRSFAVAHPFPAVETPVNDLRPDAPKTEALEGENQASDYNKPLQDLTVAAGLLYELDQESKSDRTQQPVQQAVQSFEQPKNERPDESGIMPNGLVDGIRPTGSRCLPAEAANVARMQFEGLLKLMEPDEFLKLAIGHYAKVTGCSSASAIEVAINVWEEDF